MFARVLHHMAPGLIGVVVGGTEGLCPRQLALLRTGHASRGSSVGIDEATLAFTATNVFTRGVGWNEIQYVYCKMCLHETNCAYFPDIHSYLYGLFQKRRDPLCRYGFMHRVLLSDKFRTCFNTEANSINLCPFKGGWYPFSKNFC